MQTDNRVASPTQTLYMDGSENVDISVEMSIERPTVDTNSTSLSPSSSNDAVVDTKSSGGFRQWRKQRGKTMLHTYRFTAKIQVPAVGADPEQARFIFGQLFR